MATELGAAYVQIVPSAKGISGSISKQINPEADSAGKSAGLKLGTGLKVAAASALAAGGVVLGKIISSSIAEGSNLQQSLGGIETLFKGSAGKVKQYANEAYKTSGLSANAYMENVTSFSASLLQSLGGNTEKAADKANMAMVDMSDNSNKMGSNMEDIQNAYQGFAKQNYTMLDNLKLGYGGTKEEMQRLLADATKLTGVKYNINNLSDVYSAIHAVQGQLDITGTTAKEASTTFSGSMNAMKAAASNVLGKMSLGQDIGPALNSLVSTTSTFLFNNFLPMVTNVLKSLPGAIRTLLSTAGPQFLESGRKLITNLATGIDGGKGAVTTTFSGIFDALKTSISGLNFDGLKAVIDATIPAITNMGGVIMTIIGPAIQQFITSASQLWNALQPLWTIMATALMPILQVLGAFLGGIIKGVLMSVSGLMDMLRIGIQILTPVIGVLVGAFKAVAPVLTVVAQWVGTVIGTFTSLSSAGGSLRDILSSAWKNISGAVRSAGGIIGDIVAKIKSVFNSLKHIDLLGAGKAIIEGFVKGLKGAWEAGKKFIGGIANWIKKHKGPISYDKKLLIPAGNAIMFGLNSGLQESFKNVQSTVSGMAEKLSFTATPTANLQLAGNYGEAQQVLLSQSRYGSSSESGTSTTDVANNKVYEIYVTSTLDGREIAKSTARYTQEELDRLQKQQNRMRGDLY